MHRSLFGSLDQTPYKQHIQEVNTNARGPQKGPQKIPVTADMKPAGVKNWVQVDKVASVKTIQEVGGSVPS